MFTQQRISGVGRMGSTFIQTPAVVIAEIDGSRSLGGQFQTGHLGNLTGNFKGFVENLRISIQGILSVPGELVKTVFERLTCPFAQIRPFGSAAAVVERLTVKTDLGFGGKVAHDLYRITGVVERTAHAEIGAGTGGVRVAADVKIAIPAERNINGIQAGTGVAVEHMERDAGENFFSVGSEGFGVVGKAVVPPAPEGNAVKVTGRTGVAEAVVHGVFAETVFGFDLFGNLINGGNFAAVAGAAVNVADAVGGFINAVQKSDEFALFLVFFKTGGNAVQMFERQFDRDRLGGVNSLALADIH